MTTVFCKKLKKELPSLKSAPFPGDLGDELLNNISQEAWQLWLDHQVMLINEYKLNLLDPEARQFLIKEMKKFLFEDQEEKPSGYKPVSSS